MPGSLLELLGRRGGDLVASEILQRSLYAVQVPPIGLDGDLGGVDERCDPVLHIAFELRPDAVYHRVGLVPRYAAYDRACEIIPLRVGDSGGRDPHQRAVFSPSMSPTIRPSIQAVPPTSTAGMPAKVSAAAPWPMTLRTSQSSSTSISKPTKMRRTTALASASERGMNECSPAATLRSRAVATPSSTRPIRSP